MPKAKAAKPVLVMPKKPNVHPADELAALREDIKRLQARADDVRDDLLKEGADLVGNEYYADIKDQTRETLDRKALEDTYGADFVKPFLKCTSFKVVKTERINHAKSRENPF